MTRCFLAHCFDAGGKLSVSCVTFLLKGPSMLWVSREASALFHSSHKVGSSSAAHNDILIPISATRGAQRWGLNGLNDLNVLNAFHPRG